MNDLTELFWRASLDEIKQGWLHDAKSGKYICLICGHHCEDGCIYPSDGQLYEAKKMMQIHIETEHVSPLAYLLTLDKKLTGLTEHQTKLVELFAAGFSDKEVAERSGVGSTSTIRNHRFALREKHKQAKVFTAIMDLFEEGLAPKITFVNLPRSTRNVDERFAFTQDEESSIVAEYFPEGPDGPLRCLPTKEKRRLMILRHLLRYFEPEVHYTEKQVNQILRQVHEDYALLRRYMIEYGFMDRKADGSEYWLRP